MSNVHYIQELSIVAHAYVYFTIWPLLCDVHNELIFVDTCLYVCVLITLQYEYNWYYTMDWFVYDDRELFHCYCYQMYLQIKFIDYKRLSFYQHLFKITHFYSEVIISPTPQNNNTKSQYIFFKLALPQIVDKWIIRPASTKKMQTLCWGSFSLSPMVT